MPQLLVTINDQSKLPNLRRVIKSLHGVDQVVVPRKKKDTQGPLIDSIQKKQLARLERLAKLKQNWDDEGAFPIEVSVLDNLRSLIMADGAQMLKDWVLFPATNGTIQLKAKKKRAVISIGNNDYSYFFYGNDGEEYANHKQLTTNALMQLIKRINE